MDWRYSPPSQRVHWTLLDPNDLFDELSGSDVFSRVFITLTASWYPRVMPIGVSLGTLSEIPVFYLFGLNQGDVDSLRRRFRELPDFDHAPDEFGFSQSSAASIRPWCEDISSERTFRSHDEFQIVQSHRAMAKRSDVG